MDRAHTSALIVDDDVVTRAMLAEILEEEGFNVSTASNGFSALRLAAEHRPQLIVLDLVLPELSGFEVLRELRGNHDTRDTAIVVVSGNAAMLSAAQRAELDAVVGKPFDINTLIAAVHRAVEDARHRAAEVQRVAPLVPGHERVRTRRTAPARRTGGRR